jgi:predicted RNase H-like nuclease (RuvC/YqgF family)
MSSSGPSEENPLADIINPYMWELKMHLKELSLKDGELQIKDVQVSKGEGSLEARMEALEQEVFKYKKMAEREVDFIHRINQELVTKYRKETTELWKDIFSLHETTNQLQAQLYDLQNQNCEYEARFQQMSVAASFGILETKTSFLDGEPLPWKYDDDKDSPPPLKE